MTPEQEKHYDNYFDTFSTEGWKQFVQEIKEILDGHRIEEIKDEKHLSYIKGQRDALNRVVRFEGGIRLSYDVIKEREAE